jgi:hypothetical protein
MRHSGAASMRMSVLGHELKHRTYAILGVAQRSTAAVWQLWPELQLTWMQR